MTHPKFDEVWQVSAYQAFNRMARLDVAPDPDDLRVATRRLIDAVLAYSPREDHDWRCEYRTAEKGWVSGGPPVIECKCGFDDLGRAVRDALNALAAADR